MKILMINVRIGSGSAGTIVSDLYYGITNHGFECKIAYSRGGIRNIPKKDTIRIGNAIDVILHGALTRIFGRTATYSRIATRKLIEHIDAYKPDIVHIHGLYGYYINMEILFKYIKSNNMALITTLHSCWDFTGHCCYFDYVKCEEWTKSCKVCPQIGSYPASLFGDSTRRNLIKKGMLYHSISRTCLVSPSNWMDSLVGKSCLKDVSHVVIHNGIDLSNFRPKIDYNYIHYLGIDNGYPTILAVASLWDKRKGLNDIVEFARLFEEEKLNIVVVGLSNSQVCKMPKKIIGLNRTDNLGQLVSLYSFSTVLFNPTYEDNYPTVNLEAIACHTPVITYNTGGSYECTMDGLYGLKIEKKDYEGLFELVNQVHYNTLSFRFDDLYSISKDKMINEYIELYKNYGTSDK